MRTEPHKPVSLRLEIQMLMTDSQRCTGLFKTPLCGPLHSEAGPPGGPGSAHCPLPPEGEQRPLARAWEGGTHAQSGTVSLGQGCLLTWGHACHHGLLPPGSEPEVTGRGGEVWGDSVRIFGRGVVSVWPSRPRTSHAGMERGASLRAPSCNSNSWCFPGSRRSANAELPRP